MRHGRACYPHSDATRHGGITNTKVSSPILEIGCSIAALKLIDELILVRRGVVPVQYGKGERHVLRRGHDSPEGNLTERKLSENRHNFPQLERENEFVDAKLYQENAASDLSSLSTHRSGEVCAPLNRMLSTFRKAQLRVTQVSSICRLRISGYFTRTIER